MYKQKFIDINQCQIAYTQNTSDPKVLPIVFLHGNSSSSKIYQPLFGASLSQHYRLISLDFPGHGDSDKSNAFDYSMPFYANILKEFVTALQVEHAVFVGHSLGGHIALEAVDLLPKAKGHFVFSLPPLKNPPNLDETFGENPVISLLFKQNLSEEDMQIWAKTFLGSHLNLDYLIYDLRRTHPEARVKLANSVAAALYKDEMKVLENTNKKIALLYGEEDPIIKKEYMENLSFPSLWSNGAIEIKGAGHYIQLDNPQFLALKIGEFIESIK